MSHKLLLVVKHVDEIDPAQALVAALPERSFAISFALEDLRTRFGESAHETSTDPFEHVLAPQEIELVLCFSGARELGPNSNFLLLDYFDAIGIPTVELQCDLLRCPASSRARTAARHYLGWTDHTGSGEDGIGYLGPKPQPKTETATRDDVVLVSSQLAHPAYSEKQRFEFAFAVMRLAREHPQLTFLWRATPAEEQSADAKLVFAMLGSSGPSNLWLEDNEPVHALLGRVGAVVTMAQTALLDYAAAQKPTLVYLPSELAPRLDALVSCATFVNPEQLLLGFAQLRSGPARFVVQTQIAGLRADTLRTTLERIAQTRTLKADRRELTLRYMGHMQAARARVDVGRLGPQLSALDKRLSELEKAIAAQPEKTASATLKLMPQGSRPVSLARRAIRLVKQVQKRAFKP